MSSEINAAVRISIEEMLPEDVIREIGADHPDVAVCVTRICSTLILDREEASKVLCATRQLSTKAMDEIRAALGVPSGADDKTLNRVVDYVRILRARAIKAEAELAELTKEKP